MADTEEVRDTYVYGYDEWVSGYGLLLREQEFDRWLAQERAETLKQAAAAIYSDEGPDHPLSVATWLRERAAALRADGAS